jgi:hypothetical protein
LLEWANSCHQISLQRNHYYKQTRKLWTFLVMTFLTIFSKDTIYFMLFIVVIRASPHGINKRVHQEHPIPLVGVSKTCGLLLRISNTYNWKLYQVIMGACEWLPSLKDHLQKGEHVGKQPCTCTPFSHSLTVFYFHWTTFVAHNSLFVRAIFAHIK